MAATVLRALTVFERECDLTLGWLSATETLWINAPPAREIRKLLKAPQMEALYEAAYLRLFLAWEVFLEEVCVRHMGRGTTASYVPVPPPGKRLYSSHAQARVALYEGKSYILWHNPGRVANRVARWLDGSPLEAVVRSNEVRLDQFAQVRHRIAHASDDARAKFIQAANQRTGAHYDGRPGKLLRASDTGDPMNMTRWIVVFEKELRSLAQAIVA